MLVAQLVDPLLRLVEQLIARNRDGIRQWSAGRHGRLGGWPRHGWRRRAPVRRRCGARPVTLETSKRAAAPYVPAGGCATYEEDDQQGWKENATPRLFAHCARETRLADARFRRREIHRAYRWCRTLPRDVHLVW